MHTHQKHTQKSSKIDVRLTSEERQILEQFSAKEGLKKGEYVRLLLRNQSSGFTFSDEQFCALKIEFGKLSLLGNNLNQITRRLNSNFGVLDFDDEVLMEVLSEVKKQVFALQDDLANALQKHRRS